MNIATKTKMETTEVQDTIEKAKRFCGGDVHLGDCLEMYREKIRRDFMELVKSTVIQNGEKVRTYNDTTRWKLDIQTVANITGIARKTIEFLFSSNNPDYHYSETGVFFNNEEETHYYLRCDEYGNVLSKNVKSITESVCIIVVEEN